MNMATEKIRVVMFVMKNLKTGEMNIDVFSHDHKIKYFGRDIEHLVPEWILTYVIETVINF